MAKGPRGEGWRLAKHTPEANLRSTPRIKTPKTKIIFEGLFGVLGLENFKMVLQGYLLLVGCCCCLPAAACLLPLPACLPAACFCLPAACLLLACCCCWWLPAACLLPAFACLLLLLPAASCLLLPLCKHCAEKYGLEFPLRNALARVRYKTGLDLKILPKKHLGLTILY